MANSLITTSKIANSDRELALKFVKATIKGWQLSLDPSNEKDSIDALALMMRESGAPNDPEFRNKSSEKIERTRDLVLPSQSEVTIGQIDVDDWEQTEEIMREAGLFDKPDGSRPAKIGIRGRLLIDFVKASLEL